VKIKNFCLNKVKKKPIPVATKWQKVSAQNGAQVAHNSQLTIIIIVITKKQFQETLDY